jgi:hypothetical protein
MKISRDVSTVAVTQNVQFIYGLTDISHIDITACPQRNYSQTQAALPLGSYAI